MNTTTYILSNLVLGILVLGAVYAIAIHAIRGGHRDVTATSVAPEIRRQAERLAA